MDLRTDLRQFYDTEGGEAGRGGMSSFCREDKRSWAYRSVQPFLQTFETRPRVCIETLTLDATETPGVQFTKYLTIYHNIILSLLTYPSDLERAEIFLR